MKVPVLPIAVLVTAGLVVGLAPGPFAPPALSHGSGGSQDTTNETTETPSYPIPDNLVVDLRLFESRAISPDYTAMSELSFFIMTDGRDVSAKQWPSTLAKQVPDTFLAVGHDEETATVRDLLDESSSCHYHAARALIALLESKRVQPA